MQLRVPQPGQQRLLPPPAGGDAESGLQWSWMDASGRPISAGSGGSGARQGKSAALWSGGGGAAGAEAACGSSSGEYSDDDEEDDEEEDESDGGSDGGSSFTEEEAREMVQRQMGMQVQHMGGLLAAVASRLDELAAYAAAAVARGGAGSGEGEALRFEQTLLAVVAQAQRLLK